MTSTGGDDPRTSIRSLDPIDPSAPPPDGSHLLRAVLAEPRQTRPPRRRVRVLQLAPVGLVVAIVAGVAAVSVAGGGSDERDAARGIGGTAIVHYVVRERWIAPDGSQEPAFTHEFWRLDDGSRARSVSHWEGEGPLQGTMTEDVVTSMQTLAYRPGTEQESARIIRYRATDDFAAIPEEPPTFAAPPIGGSPAVGDPRALPDRLANGDKDVTQLADTTVRDIPVEQFQVGSCPEPAPRQTENAPNGLVALPQRAIVALARDTLTPVRVTYEGCPREQLSTEGRIVDYLSFETLPPTPENLKQLEMSPHPGVPIVDGIEIDKAEERDEAGTAPTPAPTPTPTTTPTGG